MLNPSFTYYLFVCVLSCVYVQLIEHNRNYEFFTSMYYFNLDSILLQNLFGFATVFHRIYHNSRFLLIYKNEGCVHSKAYLSGEKKKFSYTRKSSKYPKIFLFSNIYLFEICKSDLFE